MHGHHLHAFGAFFLFLLTLEHVAQHQLADGILDGHVAFLVLVEGVLQRFDEEPHVTHARLGDLVAGGVLAQPVLVVDIHDHAANGTDRVVSAAEFADLVDVALEA